MNKWIKVGLLLVPALLMSACGSTNVKKKEGAPVTGGAAPSQDGATATPFGGGGEGAVTPLPGAGGTAQSGVDPLNDPSSPLAKRVVYFDYDSSAIRDDDRATIEAHAKYLAQHADAKVTLEGHTDERGSREYNIALGERRANSVRDLMSLQGVAPNQISTVSYGEERPAVLGSDESAYRMNRRVEIVYSGSK